MKRAIPKLVVVTSLAGLLAAHTPASAVDMIHAGSSGSRTNLSDLERGVERGIQQGVASKIAQGLKQINQKRGYQEDKNAYDSFFSAYNEAMRHASDPKNPESDKYKGLAIVAAMHAAWVLLNTRHDVTGEASRGNEWSNNAQTALGHYNRAFELRKQLGGGEIFLYGHEIGRVKVADLAHIGKRMGEAYTKLGMPYQSMKK